MHKCRSNNVISQMNRHVVWVGGNKDVNTLLHACLESTTWFAFLKTKHSCTWTRFIITLSVNSVPLNGFGCSCRCFPPHNFVQATWYVLSYRTHWITALYKTHPAVHFPTWHKLARQTTCNQNTTCVIQMSFPSLNNLGNPWNGSIRPFSVFNYLLKIHTATNQLCWSKICKYKAFFG